MTNDNFESLKKQITDLESMFGDNIDEEFDYNEILKESGLDLGLLESELENYSAKRELGYKVLSDDAVHPKYNYPTDSGFDLHSVVDVILPPFGRALVPTGLSFDIPDGYEIQVRPKSGLAINQGLTVLNTPGTADCGYTGEIKVIVFNTNNSEFTIPKGMKVAQAVLCPVVNGKWVELISVDEIKEKDRGSAGFGSTGI
jgi:dUTP pyrophosphatase